MLRLIERWREWRARWAWAEEMERRARNYDFGPRRYPDERIPPKEPE